MSGPNKYVHDHGILLLGETGTETDFACQVTTITVEPSVDTEDDVSVLCGDTVPGAATYTATLNATVFQDLPLQEGLTRYSWDHKGEQIHCRYFPNAQDMAGCAVDGTVTVQPMTVGGDLRTQPTSDIEWDFVGFPEILDDAVDPLDPGNGTRAASGSGSSSTGSTGSTGSSSSSSGASTGTAA